MKKTIECLLNNGYCMFIEKDSRGVCIEVTKHGREPDAYEYEKTFCGKDIEEVALAVVTAIYEASQ